MNKILSIIGLLLIQACAGNGIQSSLNPAGPIGNELEEVIWVLTGISTVVFIAVLIYLILALKQESNKKRQPKEGFILLTGLIIPTLILIGMLIYSLQSTMKVRQIDEKKSSLTIEIIGHQYWWEVKYPDHGLVSANEVYIPTGENIRLRLSSRDVIHSFWIPNVRGKMDMLPDMVTELTINVTAPGTYRGQCAEFCGVQHALMAMHLIALPKPEFDEWIKEKQKKIERRLTKIQSKGKDIFFRTSCQTCHAIEGTQAQGKSGPDLTFIGSRTSLGAGIIPNNTENLRRWINHSQKIKPYNRMPEYNLGPTELDALTRYLESLK